jgi:hypothetical protein
MILKKKVGIRNRGSPEEKEHGRDKKYGEDRFST